MVLPLQDGVFAPIQSTQPAAYIFAGVLLASGVVESLNGIPELIPQAREGSNN